MSNSQLLFAMMETNEFQCAHSQIPKLPLLVPHIALYYRMELSFVKAHFLLSFHD